MATRIIPENTNSSRPSPTGAHAAVATRVRPTGTPPSGAAAALSTPQILAAISRETQDLIKTQIDLVKAEIRADVTRELNTVKGFGAAALAVLAGLNLLFVAGVLGLAEVMPAWLAALVGTAMLWMVGAAVAVYAWKTRVRKPLEHSRREVSRDVRWMKDRLTSAEESV